MCAAPAGLTRVSRVGERIRVEPSGSAEDGAAFSVDYQTLHAQRGRTSSTFTNTQDRHDVKADLHRVRVQRPPHPDNLARQL